MSEPKVSESCAQLRRPTVVRGFVGHIESLGTTFGAVAEQLAARPTVDPDGWGSAQAADPWPRPLPVDLAAATHARLRQHYMAQQPGHLRTLTFVTRTSHSLMSLEDHEGALVLAITYVAGPEAAPPVVATPGTTTDLPTNVPVDVRIAVRGLQFVVAATLCEQLLAEAPSAEVASARVTTLLGLAAVWHDDLRLAETLSRIARLKSNDWALRAAAIAVARRAGYELLLYELWAGEQDPELYAELRRLLSPEPTSLQSGE